MKKCPKCGATLFGVTAHVTQDWIVDGDGAFRTCVNSCVEVTHRPDDDDVWTCIKCFYEDAGSKFNTMKE